MCDAMALDRYRHNREGNSPATALICDALERAGFTGPKNDTIKSLLDEAEELFGADMDEEMAKAKAMVQSDKRMTKS